MGDIFHLDGVIKTGEKNLSNKKKAYTLKTRRGRPR